MLIIIAVRILPGKAEPSELEAMEGHEANREALNALPSEAKLAAEAAAVKVEFCKPVLPGLSRKQKTAQNLAEVIKSNEAWFKKYAQKMKRIRRTRNRKNELLRAKAIEEVHFCL